MPAQRRVEIGVDGKPEAPRQVAIGVIRRTEPEIEQRPSAASLNLVLHCPYPSTAAVSFGFVSAFRLVASPGRLGSCSQADCRHARTPMKRSQTYLVT